MIMQKHFQSAPLVECLICLGLVDNSEDLKSFRLACWDMGSMTTISMDDAEVTHIIIPLNYEGGEIVVVCNSFLNLSYIYLVGRIIREFPSLRKNIVDSKVSRIV